MWNYRAILHDLDPIEAWVGLHEVYYDDDRNIVNWTEKPVSFVCDEDEDMGNSLSLALNDLASNPVLRESDLLKGCINEQA